METQFKLLDVWKIGNVDMSVKESDRKQAIKASSLLSDNPFPSSMCTEQMPMEWWEEAIVCAVCFVFFGSLLYGPFLFIALLVVNFRAAVTLAAILAALVIFPKDIFVRSTCFSYIATLILRYFSYRGAWKDFMPTGRQMILVAPPHGLFPVGNILAILALPRFAGFYVRGAAASAVLNFPIAGHMLRWIGLIDVSRESVTAALDNGEVIGLSSGGIAEIFETNSDTGTECIIMRSRGGMCKLAFQTGATIIPCYLFGNSKAFRIWYDKYGFLQWLSRKCRMSLVLFFGRWGLPIPYRTPVLGVCGSPIDVPKTANPTKEEVDALLVRVIDSVQDLFDVHKASYRWSDVKLIIK